MSKTAVFGIYPNRTTLETGVARLKREGFRHEDISILMAHSDGGGDLAIEKSVTTLAAPNVPPR